MSKVSVASGVFGCALALAADAALAAPSRASSRIPRGNALVLRLAFGADGCTDKWCEHEDPLVFLRAGGSVRLFRFLSLGVQFDFFSTDPEDYGLWEQDRTWAVFLGPEVRAILPLELLGPVPLDLWTGFAPGWFHHHTDGAVEVMGIRSEGNWWSDAFALGWGFGMDYVLAGRVGLGAAFWLYKPWVDEICNDLNDSCSSLDQDDVGIVWSVGVQANYHLPLAL